MTETELLLIMAAIWIISGIVVWEFLIASLKFLTGGRK
jgi:hypothetical protein